MRTRCCTSSVLGCVLCSRLKAQMTHSKLDFRVIHESSHDSDCFLLFSGHKGVLATPSGYTAGAVKHFFLGVGLEHPKSTKQLHRLSCR